MLRHADDANTKRREAISQSPADRPVTDHEHGLAFQVVGWGFVGGTAIPFALALRLHILWEPALHRQDRSQDPLRHRTVVHADRPANGYARRGARQKPVDAGSSACFSTSSTREARWKVIFSRTLCGTSSMSFSFRFGRMTSVRPMRCAASTFCLTPPIGSTKP